jgi:hypothetical protein
VSFCKTVRVPESSEPEESHSVNQTVHLSMGTAS